MISIYIYINISAGPLWATRLWERRLRTSTFTASSNFKVYSIKVSVQSSCNLFMCYCSTIGTLDEHFPLHWAYYLTRPGGGSMNIFPSPGHIISDSAFSQNDQTISNKISLTRIRSPLRFFCFETQNGAHNPSAHQYYVALFNKIANPPFPVDHLLGPKESSKTAPE